MSTPFLGEIRNFGFNFAPRGWAQCNGQLLAISTNTALFSLLGTTYGGNGTTNFALPDLRGRVPVGMGTGPGLTNRVQGGAAGAETASLLTTNLPAHSHALNAKAGIGNQAAPSNHLLAASDQRNSQYTSAGADAVMAATSIGSTGSGTPIDIMPPYLGTNYCIALEGIYPSRP